MEDAGALVYMLLGKPGRIIVPYGDHLRMSVCDALWCTLHANLHVTDGGVFDADPFRTAVQEFVHKKQAVPAFYQIFLKAIGCNWLVCLACYLGMQGRDLASKVIGLWWPIFAFVSLGLDHVVANMFIIPMGIWVQTPDVTVTLYIWKGTEHSRSTSFARSLICLPFHRRHHSSCSWKHAGRCALLRHVLLVDVFLR